MVSNEPANLTHVMCPIDRFAYVYFDSHAAVAKAIGKSEGELGKRKLLIKNGYNYKRRSDKPNVPASTGTPTTIPIPTANSSATPSHQAQEPTSKETDKPEDAQGQSEGAKALFIGNLSFATTMDGLRTAMEPFGTIIRLHMATFEDTGKCKGYVDSTNVPREIHSYHHSTSYAGIEFSTAEEAAARSSGDRGEEPTERSEVAAAAGRREEASEEATEGQPPESGVLEGARESRPADLERLVQEVEASLATAHACSVPEGTCMC